MAKNGISTRQVKYENYAWQIQNPISFLGGPKPRYSKRDCNSLLEKASKLGANNSQYSMRTIVRLQVI